MAHPEVCSSVGGHHLPQVSLQGLENKLHIMMQGLRAQTLSA